MEARLLDFRALLLLLDLQQQRTVDVRQDTAESDGGTNESVELLVTANGELQMTGRNTLDLEILGSVAGQLEYFGGQVLENCSDVDGGWKDSSAHVHRRGGGKL